MFFYPDDYLRLRDRVAAAGLRRADHPGIMPITSVAGIERVALLSGARFPAAIWRSGCSGRPATGPRSARSASTTRRACAERLLAEGAPGLHFYTLNGSRATREIYQRLGLGERQPAARLGRQAVSRAAAARGGPGERQLRAHDRVRRVGAREAVAGQQVGEAQAPVEAPGPVSAVLGGQQRGALQPARCGQREQHGPADAAALVVRVHVHLGDLERVGQPGLAPAPGGGRQASALRTTSCHHWPSAPRNP